MLTSFYSRKASYSPFDLTYRCTLALHRHLKYCTAWQRPAQASNVLWIRHNHQRWMRSSRLKAAIHLSRDQAQMFHQHLHKTMHLTSQQDQASPCRRRHLIIQRRRLVTKMRSQQTLHLSMHLDLTMHRRLQVMITCCGRTRRKAGLISGRSE